jgi:type II secretory pathway predicted ATPase ExeA
MSKRHYVEAFYHLTATPFRLTPDPKFCFSHSGHAEARAYLQYAFALGEGFIILTGRPGAGKTTLIESFLKELEASKVATARIAPANLETTDLLRSVAFAYHIQAEGLDKATLLRRISQNFSTLMHQGRRVLLVIDEAQGFRRAPRNCACRDLGGRAHCRRYFSSAGKTAQSHARARHGATATTRDRDH